MTSQKLIRFAPCVADELIKAGAAEVRMDDPLAGASSDGTDKPQSNADEAPVEDKGGVNDGPPQVKG